jgi:hypothetical protein
MHSPSIVQHAKNVTSPSYMCVARHHCMHWRNGSLILIASGDEENQTNVPSPTVSDNEPKKLATTTCHTNIAITDVSSFERAVLTYARGTVFDKWTSRSRRETVYAIKLHYTKHCTSYVSRHLQEHGQIASARSSCRMRQ